MTKQVVYRKIPVSERLPNLYELAGEELFYIDFKDRSCVYKLGGLPPDEEDFKAIVKYWLEAVELPSEVELNEKCPYKFQYGVKNRETWLEGCKHLLDKILKTK